MFSAVCICSSVLEEMLAHAHREYPRECCGLLFGSGEVIEGIWPTRNEKESQSEFFVPVEELFAFFKQMRRCGYRHLGIYHSHPNAPAKPSRRDAAEFHYPEVSFWIVSLRGEKPDIRSFLWRESEFQEIPFEVVDAKETQTRAR